MACAADIDAARQRLISFVISCGDEQWRAAPLDGDPRPVAVVVDHVAHAYEYLAGWISDLVAGRPVEVNSDIVDALNARHARAAAQVSRAEATEHLRRSGEAISRLVEGLSAADLTAGDGMVRRLAQIAARHADDHRTDIQAALTVHGIRRTLTRLRKATLFRAVLVPNRSPIHFSAAQEDEKQPE
jgi:DinB superfamily